MKVVKSLVLSLVLITACLFASCSQDELLEPQTQVQNEDATTRAMSDIFNVEEVCFPEGLQSWYKDIRGVDREGNFYITLYSHAHGEYFIYKYDLAMGTFAPFINYVDYTSNNTTTLCERFCFDENNNLCYLVQNPGNGKFGVRRVRADGNAVSEQWFDNIISASSVDADAKGNLFILDSYAKNGMRFCKLFKLNTNGVLSEIGVDLSDVSNAVRLYKASGAVMYLYNYWDNCWHKLNTNTGLIEKIERLGNFSWEMQFTSSYSKANLYMLRDDNCVMQLRPNAASDLVLGVIPSSYKNTDGVFVETNVLATRPPELYMNTDATIFYTISNKGFYKLTLP